MTPSKMASSIYAVVDDKDFDDAALWAVIDSAAAASAAASSKSRKPLTITYPKTFNSPTPLPRISDSSPPMRTPKNPRPCYSESESNLAGAGEVLQEPWVFRPPRKVGRPSSTELGEVSPMSVVRSAQRLPGAMSYSSPEKYLSPEIGRFSGSECSPASCARSQEKEIPGHCLSGMFPSVSLFKEYQNAAMAILEKSDFTMISGNPFIKKSGWRKISFYFNVSYEIKDKSIEFDEQRNVQRAEFVVRAYMQGGRFSDGWGSCERREKRFQKPNHDIPSTAETRAKNRACQDLLGIGEYRPGMAQVNGQR